MFNESIFEPIRILKNFFHISHTLIIHHNSFRTDNAKNFCNRKLKEFFENEGKRHVPSCPYTPQQNGLAERKIGDSMNKGGTFSFISPKPVIDLNWSGKRSRVRFPNILEQLHRILSLTNK